MVNYVQQMRPNILQHPKYILKEKGISTCQNYIIFIQPAEKMGIPITASRVKQMINKFQKAELLVSSVKKKEVKCKGLSDLIIRPKFSEAEFFTSSHEVCTI